jgi:N-acetyl-anhydromuramyl-L-alanine amidase AmpD
MGDILMDNKTFLLSTNNYYPSGYNKTQIVVGNTLSTGFNHFTKWTTRLNGHYKNTAPFTITLDGAIHMHYHPSHHSNFIGVKDIDRHIIPIVLENEGWLEKDFKTNELIDWVGNIYNREDEIVETRWRGRNLWAPYSEEQIDSLVVLCKSLSKQFDIPTQAMSHNTRVETIDDYNGVAFRSNFSKYYSDVSPAFDFNGFKNKLELK